MLSIGSLLDGKYKILNEIGHGGMSVVYLALNERANKTWAVKEVRKDGKNANEVVKQGLVAETEMLKKLSHPNLPSIIDVIDREDSFIIVMDYIEGKSLQSVLNHEGAQDTDTVVEWAKQLCDVLGYLHSRKPPIIYRDLKPANVMLKPNGDITLIDFGTAREYKERALGDTTWLGTRGYAAPEQFGGQGETDARTDIYNLGATMYHLLTGYSPADTQFVIHPLGKIRPELAGSGIEKIVAKCCEPKRADRFQDCAELMYALEHVHDEDDIVRRARDRKWYTFTACLAVAAAGIIGMIAFGMLRRNTARNSYEQCILRAKNASTVMEAEDEYQLAMSLDPENPEAYTVITEKIDEDGVFSDEENKTLNNCCNAYPLRGGSSSNIETFQLRNEKEYINFRYEIGTEYFFYKNNGYTDAANVLGQIYENDFLSPQKKNIAKSLYMIASSVNKASGGKGSNYMTSEGTRGVWDSFNALVGQAVTATENCGDSTVAMAVYRQLCLNISKDVSKFAAAGITQTQMEDLLEQAEIFIDENNFENSNNEAARNLYEQTSIALESAKKAVSQSYHKVGTEKSERSGE